MKKEMNMTEPKGGLLACDSLFLKIKRSKQLHIGKQEHIFIQICCPEKV